MVKIKLNLAKKCFFVLAFCFFSHHIADAKTPLLLGGQYLDLYNTMFPILYISHDFGRTWKYKINSKDTLPRDFKTDGLILFSHTEESFSIIGGAYSDEEKKYPLIGRSNNNGIDWHYPIQKAKKPENLPAQFANNGMLTHMTCKNNICAAIGEYESDGGHIYPMLAMSQDRGLTWNFPIDGNHLPTGFSFEEYLNAVHCSNQLCLTVGEYKINDRTIHPTAVISDNQGKRWNYIVDHTINIPTQYANYGIFRQAHCTENHCIAAGVYMNHMRRMLPMIAVGSNKNNWTYKVQHDQQLPNDFFDYSSIHDMECKNNMCAVVGGYDDKKYNQYPMLLVTTDAGENWKYQIDKTENSLPFDFLGYSELNKVSCSENICAAVGRYRANDQIQYPFIITSTDRGKTWKYAVQKGLNEPPAPFADSGSFSNVHCFEKRCAATGYYVDDQDAVFPMVIESHDQGQTWQYQVGSGLALPYQYKSLGGLFTVKCTKDICYSGGRYIDTEGQDFPMLVTSSLKNEPWKFIVDGANQLPPDYATYGYFTNQ